MRCLVFLRVFPLIFLALGASCRTQLDDPKFTVSLNLGDFKSDCRAGRCTDQRDGEAIGSCLPSSRTKVGYRTRQRQWFVIELCPQSVRWLNDAHLLRANTYEETAE